jgi:hypothetical protein
MNGGFGGVGRRLRIVFSFSLLSLSFSLFAAHFFFLLQQTLTYLSTRFHLPH